MSSSHVLLLSSFETQVVRFTSLGFLSCSCCSFNVVHSIQQILAFFVNKKQTWNISVNIILLNYYTSMYWQWIGLELIVTKRGLRPGSWVVVFTFSGSFYECHSNWHTTCKNVIDGLKMCVNHRWRFGKATFELLPVSSLYSSAREGSLIDRQMALETRPVSSTA